MYLLNAEVTLDWELGITESVIAFDDVDLIIIDPAGISTYLTAPIDEADFTAPTPTVPGAASYLFTPTIEGFWRIRLVIGTANSYVILSKVELQVMDNLTTVHPYLFPIGLERPGTFPALGVAGQVLTKFTDNNYDYGWVAPKTGAEYCPGHAYVFVDASTFRVDGFNVINLFSVSRRLKFTVAGIEIYGKISAVDFDTTSSGNTTIVVAMENDAELTSELTEACIVSGVLGWSPIATDPFEGESINYVISGKIGAQVWWVAVGNDGKLFTSTDKGATWTVRPTYVSNDLMVVAYDPVKEEFMAGGKGEMLFHSSNGINWTNIASNMPAITNGNGDINHIHYDLRTNNWGVYREYSTGASRIYVTNDSGETWSNGYAGSGANNTVHFSVGMPIYGADDSDKGFLCIAASQKYPWDDVEDTSVAFSRSLRAAVLDIVWFEDLAQVDDNQLNPIVVYADGAIELRGQAVSSLDDVTFSYALNSITYSQFLNLYVVAGNNGQIGYCARSDILTADAWVQTANGFDILSNVNCVHYDEDDAVFVAVANDGAICRSTNGIN